MRPKTPPNRTPEQTATLIAHMGRAAMVALDAARDEPTMTLLEAERRMGEAAYAVAFPEDVDDEGEDATEEV